MLDFLDCFSLYSFFGSAFDFLREKIEDDEDDKDEVEVGAGAGEEGTGAAADGTADGATDGRDSPPLPAPPGAAVNCSFDLDLDIFDVASYISFLEPIVNAEETREEEDEDGFELAAGTTVDDVVEDFFVIVAGTACILGAEVAVGNAPAPGGGGAAPPAAG